MFWNTFLWYTHWLINYIDTKANCCRKKLTWKGTLRQSLQTWDTVSHGWYFRPSFVNCCPSNLLSGSSLPPFPVCISIQCTRIQCVRGEGIWGQRRGRGLRQINTCQKVPSQVNFFRWRHFGLVSTLYSWLVHGYTVQCTVYDWRPEIWNGGSLFKVFHFLSSQKLTRIDSWKFARILPLSFQTGKTVSICL